MEAVSQISVGWWGNNGIKVISSQAREARGYVSMSRNKALAMCASVSWGIVLTMYEPRISMKPEACFSVKFALSGKLNWSVDELWWSVAARDGEIIVREIAVIRMSHLSMRDTESALKLFEVISEKSPLCRSAENNIGAQMWNRNLHNEMRACIKQILIPHILFNEALCLYCEASSVASEA